MMKLIKTIQFKDLSQEEIERFDLRRAARAVVFEQDNKIALLYVSQHNYHKLPGGGIEGNEEISEALKRECLEEIGCNIEIGNELGEIVEYRDQFLLNQHSYCYLAKVIGTKGNPDFTTEEIDKGFTIKWVSLSKAIELLKNDKPTSYEGKFIQIRDTLYLNEALNALHMNKEIFQTANFTVEAVEKPHVSRTDGGHIKIAPKVKLLDRTRLTPVLAIELMRLTMVVGEAMATGLNRRGIDVGRINYQDNGNWSVFKPEGPYLHIHLYGRAKSAKVHTWGDACHFPHRDTGFYDNFESLNDGDIQEIRQEIEKIFKQEKYQNQNWKL